jgi:plastocyanin
MYFARSFIASALVGLGAATTHSASGMAASETMSMGAASPSAAAGEGMVATHVVQVGGPNGTLTFSPENVKANVGDLVQFQFHPKVRCFAGR